jgi:hypothetical protein
MKKRNKQRIFFKKIALKNLSVKFEFFFSFPSLAKMQASIGVISN